MNFQAGYERINNKYDELKAEIEAKEITEEYTQEMKDAELQANENARKAELEQQDRDYKEAMDNMRNAKGGINYDYILQRIEDVDFPAPDPLEVDTTETERFMEALPSTVENTKYIYLTFDNKYIALDNMSTSEHAKYSNAYDAIEEKYNNIANQINNNYAEHNAEIEAREITEEYTQDMKDADLLFNEEQRLAAISDNDASKDEEIKTLNNEYIYTMSTIAMALTELKNDKETGFIGDVHINGKLHVDTDINLEGKLNNVPIEDYITKTDMEPIREELTNKSDSNHTHNITDITDYEPYDDTELKGMINEKANTNHTHNIADITNLQSTLNNKANASHTHNLADITDYEPFDDTELKGLINGRIPMFQYSTFDDINTNWHNIPSPSIIFAGDGPEQYTATMIIKQNDSRSLCLATNKGEKDYIWFRFQGWSSNNDWSDARPWRKIPLFQNNNLIANNLKADNETRLAAVESNKANTNHTHNIADITDLQSTLNNKANTNHTHNIADITDYEPYDDTELKSLVNGKANTNHIHTIADITDLQSTLNSRMPMFQYNTFDDIKNDWSNIPYPSIIFTGEGPEDLTATMIIKQYPWRSLCLSTHKKERDYIWVRFQGEHKDNNWTNASDWRKIPLVKNNNLIANNLKADNETRLAAVESNKADSNHTHTVFNNLVTVKPSNASEWIHIIDGLAPNIENEKTAQFQIGKEMTKDKCGYYGYVYSTTDPRLTMGLHSYDHLLQIHRDKITTSLPITATNLKSDNETRLAAVEDKIANIFNLIYPVGSIYVSMTDVSPATLFGGTWEEILDRFLYCTGKQSNTVGGSKTIAIKNLPAHSHNITQLCVRGNDNGSNQYTVATYGGKDLTITTENTGDGQDYMPPYITVHAWYRTA